MRDQLVRLHLREPGLLVVALGCGGPARRARQLHGLMPTSALLLAEGLAAGFGIAGLLGGTHRINLQLVCDGPLQGLFVDAEASGKARGYVKNRAVDFVSSTPAELGGALGGSGMLSVLRELKDGEFYRSSIELRSFDLASDLERYYLESEQTETLVRLSVGGDGGEPLGQVSGVFVQRMPDARPDALIRAQNRLAKVGLPKPDAGRPMDLVEPLFDEFPGAWEVLAEYPLEYECGCSKAGLLRAVASMGKAEIEDILRKEGSAKATCAFCGASYEVGPAELLAMLGQGTG